MKTVIYQSFRTENVPAWIDACMASVRDWAVQQGFVYRFWDDRFFDLVPAYLRPQASAHKCMLSDYARIVAARDLLAEGYERAIWVDADMIIFDPEHFEIPFTHGYAFCREIWHDCTLLRQPCFRLTVNNSLSVYCHDQTIIETYLKEAAEIILTAEPLSRTAIGPDWLLARRRQMTFQLLDNVGCFGPEMLFRYIKDDSRFLRQFFRYQKSRLQAINLGNSNDGLSYTFGGENEPWVVSNDNLSRVAARLCADKGASLNRHCAAKKPLPDDEYSRPLSYRYYWLLKLQEKYRAVRSSSKRLTRTLSLSN